MKRLLKIKNSYKLAVFITLITFIWVLSGTFKQSEEIDKRNIHQRQEEKNKTLQTVRVMDVVAKQMMQNVSISGRTESNRTVNMKSEISGRIESINFPEGKFSKKDTLLVSIAVDDRKSRYEKAKATLVEKEILYNAKIKLQEKGLSSNSAVSSAQSLLDQAKADTETAKLNLEHTKIKAPFDGVIEDKFVNVGDFVNIGQDIIKIVDLNPIKAVGYISENIRGNLKIGSKAVIQLPNKKEVEGTVSYISSSSDDTTRTYKFEVSIPNEDNSITEGLTCSIKADIITMTAHSIPPSLVVLNDAGELGVNTVDNNNIVKFYPVEFITDENDQIWLSGLPDKFTIITVGQEYVKDGIEVAPSYEKE